MNSFIPVDEPAHTIDSSRDGSVSDEVMQYISMTLVKPAANTGSTYWFGRGDDIDIIISMNMIPEELHYQITLGKKWHFASYKVNDINYIILDEKWYQAWKRATLYMDRLLALFPSVVVSIIQKHKPVRVGLFECFKKIAMHELEPN